ncbi:NAD(P)-binding domain-containing protein [Georgenia deserti]|uniref:NAD(P)-binding domain-containing protein n=1 Tax=Georgenia deserti TaxID=2093781 RepID=A0ABW4L397_9MICO
MTTPAPTRRADVVVVGAGQAGLSAGYHLQRRGFVPASPHQVAADDPGATGTFLVLDAESGPGGAWRHRWRSLRMATVNGIFGLPGMDVPDVDPCEPSREALPRYFADYEADRGLPVLRPVRVRAVRRADDDPAGNLLVEVSGEAFTGTIAARGVINATGTWSKPFWPVYPGRADFRGRQLHVADYVGAEEFAGGHVAVVGGGISAVQLLDEISRVATTTWFTRREPRWREDFDSEAGRRAVSMVADRVRRGLPPRSVVSVTGLIRTPEVRAGQARGIYDRHPMFTRIEPEGLRMADGSFLAVDAIVWATGFRAALDHLAPLRLRSPGGGIVMDGTAVAAEPRLHLVGYGPSASTVGANRAGRDAVVHLSERLAPVAA